MGERHSTQSTTPVWYILFYLFKYIYVLKGDMYDVVPATDAVSLVHNAWEVTFKFST